MRPCDRHDDGVAHAFTYLHNLGMASLGCRLQRRLVVAGGCRRCVHIGASIEQRPCAVCMTAESSGMQRCASVIVAPIELLNKVAGQQICVP